jgi:UV DNA damage endonuclease
MNKIGFCCKWIDTVDQIDGVKAKDDAKRYSTGTTTLTWMNRQTRDVAVEKLWTLTRDNIQSIRLLVERVSKLGESLRMVRLSSEILPLYTEDSWSWFYRQPDVIRYCETELAKVGEIARATGTRLSFHPGQFTVLASANDNIVTKSIEEVEYHATLARWMGYGKTFQDFKINVHISGRRGPEGIRSAYTRLSPEARNTLTMENEENSWGLDDCLSLSDLVPTVLDIHHHWCREGEYIQSTDDRIQRILDSWRGVRPTIHYSVSREDVLVGHCPATKPDFKSLKESGHNKQRLRAHSDFYWNHKVNQWALSHGEWADIMCESKAKNLASFKLFELRNHQ